MPADIKITQDFKLLNKLNKNLKDKYVAKIGILGKKSGRADKNTNALIGAVHEFGSVTKNIPRRSFLNDPLQTKSKEINATIAKSASSDLLQNNGVELIFRKAATKAEQIVQMAFATGGFGKWKPLKKETTRRKGSSSILIDSGQLRKSISSTVEKV
jgi:phage gpG-like protein